MKCLISEPLTTPKKESLLFATLANFRLRYPQQTNEQHVTTVICLAVCIVSTGKQESTKRTETESVL